MNLLICAACGQLAERPVVDTPAAGGPPVLVCACCGHRQPFRRLPLFSLTGPSGTGKSTVGRVLSSQLAERAVVLEQDVLWLAGLRDPADEHRQFRSAWLNMVAMLNQSGRPSVLCGTVVPDELERLPERPLLGRIHYLALVCDSEVLAERLRKRPAWREWTEERIAEMVEFNEWLRAAGPTLNPAVELLDTTDHAFDATVESVRSWILHRLPHPTTD